ENSPVAAVLLKAQQDLDGFQGTSAELLSRLEDLADEATRKQKRWPRAANALSNCLRHIAPNLRKVGLRVDFDREPGTGRRLVHVEWGGKDRHDRHTTPGGTTSAGASANSERGSDEREGVTIPRAQDRHATVTPSSRPAPPETPRDDPPAPGDDPVTI